MPPIKPIKRRDLIYFLRKFEFEGPFVGGKHEFMVKGSLRLGLPNPHQSDINPKLLKQILQQAGIDLDVWENL